MSLQEYMTKETETKKRQKQELSLEQREVLRIIRDWSGLSTISKHTVYSLSQASNYASITMRDVERALSSLMSQGLVEKETIITKKTKSKSYRVSKEGLGVLK